MPTWSVWPVDSSGISRPFTMNIRGALEHWKHTNANQPTWNQNPDQESESYLSCCCQWITELFRNLFIFWNLILSDSSTEVSMATKANRRVWQWHSLPDSDTRNLFMSNQVTCVLLPLRHGCCSCLLVPLVEVVKVLPWLLPFLLCYPSVSHKLLLLQASTPLPPQATVRKNSFTVDWRFRQLIITTCISYHSKDDYRDTGNNSYILNCHHL